MVRLGVSFLFFLTISGCTQLPEPVKPVKPFELNKYLGTWYEVARLDHSFEENLTQVTAEYSMRKDGGVRVINSGINKKTGERKTAEGKAYFIGKSNVGRLKVSFFGPFYGSYNIAKLDQSYTMALIVGPTLDYAWILSRSPTPARQKCQSYFQAAKKIGITSDQWIRLISCSDE